MLKPFKKAKLNLIALAIGILPAVVGTTEAIPQTSCGANTSSKQECMACCSQKSPKIQAKCKANCKEAKKTRKADKKAMKGGGRR